MTKQVIILHGIAMNRLWMSGLARHLENAGWGVHNISYPSRHKNFEALVDQHIAPAIEAATAKGGTVDIVAHSMGGILTRLYAQKYGPRKIGRAVLIGTPNHGSEVADFLRDVPLFKWHFGATGAALGTAPEDIHAVLGPVNFDCGVIAGTNHVIHFPTSYIVNIPRPNDGIVSVESTKIAGMADHATVHGDHSLLVWMPSVWQLVRQFLETGAFTPPAA